MGVAVLMTAAYDDGRPDVPGGVTGPVERVVVVGAGIAGLTVANALANAGVACVVVEARDRVGAGCTRSISRAPGWIWAVVDSPSDRESDARFRGPGRCRLPQW